MTITANQEGYIWNFSAMKEASKKITWYTNVAKIGTKRLALGLCEKTGDISHFAIYNPKKPDKAEFLKTLLIKNVSIAFGCENEKSCLDVDCPLNKTYLGYWKKAYGVDTREKLQNIRKNFEEIKEKLSLKTEQHGKFHFKKPPLEIKGLQFKMARKKFNE